MACIVVVTQAMYIASLQAYKEYAGKKSTVHFWNISTNQYWYCRAKKGFTRYGGGK